MMATIPLILLANVSQAVLPRVCPSPGPLIRMINLKRSTKDKGEACQVQSREQAVEVMPALGLFSIAFLVPHKLPAGGRLNL